MESKLNLEQAAWLTLFAIIGISLLLRLEQILIALQRARVVIVKSDEGRIIDVAYKDITGREKEIA